jgi:DNA-binding transcriptional LysR family regulator
LRERPDAHVEIDVVPMPKLWSAFLSGAYDVAVAPRMAFEGDVSGEVVYTDPVVLFAAPDHPLAVRAAIDPAELADETVIGKFREAYWGLLHDEMRQQGYRWARQVDLRSSEAVKRFVASGAGIGILFGSALEPELARSQLVELPMTGPRASQTYLLVTSSAPQPLADEFSTYLRELWSAKR